MDGTLALSLRLEILGLTLLVWLGIYFFVNKRPVDSQRRLNSDLPIDRSIPFIPQLALVYFSTYIFVLEPFFILNKPRQFWGMLVSFVSITVFASLIHALFPSQMQRMEKVNTDHLSGKLINLFQQICKPYGNFPSMHVALSVPVVGMNYMAMGVVMGSITLVWAVLIALSTLFTKQHNVLDVLVGLLGGAAIFGLVFWLMMV